MLRGSSTLTMILGNEWLKMQISSLTTWPKRQKVIYLPFTVSHQLHVEIGNDPTRKLYESNLMDRIKLKSTRAARTGQYAVGYFRNGELHITPIERVLQMRPSLEHVDEHDRRIKLQTDQSKIEPGKQRLNQPVR